MIVGFKQVKPGEFDQADSFIEFRIGLTGDDIDRMASIYKGLTEELDIDSLATAVRIASVAQ
jgi:hypothetical protein